MQPTSAVRIEHRERMQERRWRQLARKPGFTPVPNRRIQAAVARASLDLLGSGVTPDRAEAEAWRIVASRLPHAGFKRTLRPPRPSKSDDPAYRKGSR